VSPNRFISHRAITRQGYSSYSTPVPRQELIIKSGWRGSIIHTVHRVNDNTLSPTSMDLSLYLLSRNRKVILYACAMRLGSREDPKSTRDASEMDYFVNARLHCSMTFESPGRRRHIRPPHIFVRSLAIACNVFPNNAPIIRHQQSFDGITGITKSHESSFRASNEIILILQPSCTDNSGVALSRSLCSPLLTQQKRRFLSATVYAGQLYRKTKATQSRFPFIPSRSSASCAARRNRKSETAQSVRVPRSQ